MRQTKAFILHVWDSNNSEYDYTKEVFYDVESALLGAMNLASELADEWKPEKYDIEVNRDDYEVSATPATPCEDFEDSRSHFSITVKEIPAWRTVKRWVECMNELNKKCPECGKVHGTIYELDRFCPKCGCEMDVGVLD